jgi:hypothetical protein
MNAKVYITFERAGEVIEKLNEKLPGMNDKMFDLCKKAYVGKPEKLISVREETDDIRKNPEYEEYKNKFNEGEEGYNPHEPFINKGKKNKFWYV